MAGRESYLNGEPDLLIVGAGPTGLALALTARAHGASIRIVEQRPDMFRPSRAQIVHPRTLEVLRPLGVVPSLLRDADIAPAVQLHATSPSAGSTGNSLHLAP